MRISTTLGIAALTLSACSPTTAPPPKTHTVGEPVSRPAPASSAAAPTPKLTVGELVGEKKGIKVSKLAGSPKFPKARLFLQSPAFDKMIEKKQTFEFDVRNYGLGAQTVKSPILANSAKGQHIHFIVDNGPYMAKYEPQFDVELEEGSHVILAFLSRSYHESVKHGFTLTRLHVGKKTKAIADLSLDGAPHMFYSRPKGTYTGKDTEKLLLDFFLVGVELGKDGNKVEATLGGQKFLLTEWVPYVVEGLPMGKVEVDLRLVDKEGKTIPGPYNEVKRTVTLAEK